MFLERQAPLERLANDYRRASTTGGRMTLVYGEAGIGKTTLVEAFIASLPGHARVYRGGCEALFAARPLGPLFDIAEQFGGPLLELLRTEAEGHRVYAGFLALLEDRDSHGAVFVFEDIHWADDATMDFLKYAGRRIGRSRCLMLATYRDDETGPGHPLNFVIGDLPANSTSRVSLESLSQDAIAVIAECDERRARSILDVTGGNPFFVQELVSSSDQTVPRSVSDAILAKASRLPEEARRLLNLVSVVPGRCELALLRTAFPKVLELVDTGIEHGLLTADQNHVAFRHELARLAIEDSLPAGQRSHWNAYMLAELRARRPDALARLAHHADNSGDGDAVLEYSPRAAQQSARLGAHREAVALLRLALNYSDLLAEEVRAALVEKLAYELYVTGKINEAIDARRQCLELWRRSDNRLHVAMTLRWLSRLHWFAGRRAEAERFAEQALEASRPLSDTGEYAMACSNRSQLYMLGSETAPAVEWANRAIELARQNGDQGTLAHALNNLGTALCNESLEEGVRHLLTSLEISLDNGYQEHVARAYTNLASVTVATRRYTDAARYLDAGMDYTIEHDLDSWHYYMLGWRARMRLETGDWHGAKADALAVTRNHGGSTLVASPALTTLAILQLRRGDAGFEDAFEQAQTTIAGTAEIQRHAPLLAARAERAWLTGTPLARPDEVVEACHWAARLQQRWLAGELACWLRRLGIDIDTPGDLPLPCELFLQQGDERACARAWQALGCPYDAALALSGGDEAAQREALEIFTALGAEPAAARTRRKLRAAGVRDLPRKAGVSTRRNPAGLTNRQLVVLGALSDGLSDSQIAERLMISPRTVGHHVSAILGKLGVQSRTEAAVVATRLGIAGNE